MYDIPIAFGIGFRRCASSWLHKVLDDHPDIGKNKKGGLHFFSENFNNGLDWFIEHLLSSGRRKLLLDFSVSYTYPEYYNQSAKRMFHLFPNAKLFACVRNPVERAFSDYLRSLRLLELPKNMTFEDAIEKNPLLLERGLYGKLLTPYYELFGNNSILILFYDDLLINPQKYVEQLWYFLQISPIISSSINNRERAGKAPKSYFIQAMLYGIKNIFDKIAFVLKLEREWKNVKAHFVGIWNSLLSMNEQKDQILKKETKKRLIDFYYKDICLLEKFTGRKLSHWYE